jgi:peptide/nickel transport system substrate-binding protein
MRRGMLGGLLAAAIALAACGDDDDTTARETSPPAPSETATGTPSAGSTAATEPGDADDVGEPGSRGTLRYGYYIALSTFDPHRANGSNDNAWLFPVYDRLVHLTPNADPEPGLAESWEFAEDGSYLEMRLREGVTFHDGEPFDAEAVRANIVRAQTLEGSAVVSLVDHITEVEVVDDHTVRLHTAYPDASLPLVLSDRPGAMISPAAFESNLDAQPVGAGMYRVTEYREGDTAVYEAYEDYWDPSAVGLDQLVITTYIDTTTRLNALRSGQLDAAEIDPVQVADAEAAGLNLTIAPDLSFSLLQFNSRNRPELADERVRRAINHAIDRETIVEAVLQGYGEPAVQPFPSGYFAHDPDVPADLYAYDMDEARRLLEEAGYADGFAFEVVTTSTPQRVQVSEIIQASLAELGIDVTVRQIADAGTFLDHVYGQQQGDAWMLAWGGRPDPSTTVAGLYGADSFNNPSGLTTPRVTELLQQSLTEFDPERRTDVLQKLSAEVATSALDVVVLFFPEKIVASTDDVRDIAVWQAGRPEFRGVSMAG